jgi:predicted DNA-binding mobile mystery protein A
MRNKNKLLIEQLDQRLRPFKEIELIAIPEKGWVNNIRSTIKMTMAQLGSKLKITRQGVKKIETSEAKGTITINSLKEVGEAMGLKFVYGFVPYDGTIENLISKKAKSLAIKIVSRTNQNMKIEDQGLDQKKIDKSISELALEIKREMRRSLWD